MNELFPVKVECHAGHKADEYPKRFYIDNLCFHVEEIIDRWYQTSALNDENKTNGSFPPANYYKVLASDKKIYILKHETDTDRWFLLIKGESINPYHGKQ